MTGGRGGATRGMPGGGSANDGRLDFLDGLRGVAVIAVVVQHVGWYFFPAFADFSEKRFGLGVFAVTLFFFCSGFVIPASLDRHRSLVRFWIGRACRLYPAYWGSVIAAVALGALGRFPRPRGADLPAIVAVNLTLGQTLVGVPNLIGDYWTLGYEVVFYILISLLFVARLHRQSEWAAALLFLVPLIRRVLAPWLPSPSPLPDLAGATATLGFMFAGSAAHRWYSGALGRRAAAALALLVPLGTVAALGPTGDLAPLIRDGDRTLARLLSYLAACAVFAAVLHRRRLPAWLGAVGLISYSLYLSHRLIFTALPDLGGPWPTALASVALALVVSLGTYRLLERPGMALGKALSARYAAWAARALLRRLAPTARPRPADPA